MIENNKVRHLVVVDDESRAVGVVTQSNMIEHLGYEYFVEIRRVSQVMTKVLFTISKGATVDQTVTEMARNSVSCLIIAQDNRPLGMLTERDVVNLLVDHKDIWKLKVEEVMSSPVRTVSPNTSVHEVSEIMKQEHIRRVVVVDEDGKIVGLTTQTDLVRGLEVKYIETLKEVIKEKDIKIESTSRDLADKTVYLDNILRSSIYMGIVVADLDFRISYYNPGAEQILGYPAEEVIGRDVREIHFEENVGLPPFDTIAETIPKNKSQTFTFEQDKKNGKRFIDAMVSGIWDNEEKLVGFVLMLRDVTECRRAEEKLRESTRRLKIAYDQSTVYAQQLNEEITQRKQAQKALQKAHDELEQRVRERTIKLVNMTEQLKRQLTERGRVEQALRLAHKYLSKKAADLEAANEELSQYDHIVAHVLKAPLRAIHFYSDFLREDFEGTLNGDQKTYIDSLTRVVRQGAKLVDDLLEFSMVCRRSGPIETIDVGVFLQELIVSLDLPSDVEVVMGNEWPTIEAEPALVQEIFLHLISNAVKFNHLPRKRIEIGWLPAGDEHYKLFVRDNGIGIEPRYHEQIFHVFEPLYPKEFEGTGVGLAICKKIVQRHGGRIWVESEPGKGSTFYFTISSAG
ncbi:MAG: CBS domain-containing protein [Desulfobacterales bacterium]|nr:MAG: CBS domain-containing protein [Desulfobacterales bacterium]